MDTPIERRTFLEGGALTLGSLFLPGFADSNPIVTGHPFAQSLLSLNSKTVFACEGGNYGKDDTFVLGYLSVDGDISQHESAIQSLRTTFKYYTRIRYNSNDRFKINISKEINNYFLATGALSFCALVKRGTKSFNLSPKKAAMAKLGIHEELMQKSGIQGQVGNIYMKSQSPFGPSPFYANSFQERLGNTTLSVVSTVSSNLLQVAGFLTGTVRQDIQKDIKQSSVKHLLIADLKESFSQTALAPGLTIGTKFIIFD